MERRSITTQSMLRPNCETHYNATKLKARSTEESLRPICLNSVPNEMLPTYQSRSVNVSTEYFEAGPNKSEGCGQGAKWAAQTLAKAVIYAPNGVIGIGLTKFISFQLITQTLLLILHCRHGYPLGHNFNKTIHFLPGPRIPSPTDAPRTRSLAESALPKSSF
jgi:hypothetical protein